MPLRQSSSKSAFKWNVAELVSAGHPIKQSVAIAFDIKRKHGRKKVRKNRRRA